MGLLDVLNGMANGPRGEKKPGEGGMSPLTMAILALLAYKAYGKIAGSGHAPAGAGRTPIPAPAPAPTQANLPGGGGLGDVLGGLLGGGKGAAPGGAAGGGMSDLMKGALGGLLAGGAAGSILSGGLGDLLKQFQDSGHGEVANSWVSPGENKAITPGDLSNALGADQIQAMMESSGLSQDELLSQLSSQLPDIVNQLTPDGRLPTEQEASRWI
jgi:uncharacterized protein YidB (DUF937 family)